MHGRCPEKCELGGGALQGPQVWQKEAPSFNHMVHLWNRAHREKPTVQQLPCWSLFLSPLPHTGQAAPASGPLHIRCPLPDTHFPWIFAFLLVPQVQLKCHLVIEVSSPHLSYLSLSIPLFYIVLHNVVSSQFVYFVHSLPALLECETPGMGTWFTLCLPRSQAQAWDSSLKE